ncbi:50S ribosomal protein L32 [Isoptericola sp. 4D.3]|uniref:50S ribosomal protein L32 n=1 Tax=Isoptericola peretonis TaxID=2918523 RepID=A0ABT0J178_9MICO|nr:50S ribosomal protein L32 [Isoptericola sp. 4D.3]
MAATAKSASPTACSQWKAPQVALVPVVVGGRTVRVPPRLARAVRRGLVDPG